jgi:hypothetical protein
MHGALPPLHEVQELLNPTIKHDIYAIGTQECQRSIAASLLSKSKQTWENMLA